MSKYMKIHFFPKGHRSVPSSRMRVWHLSDALNELGVKTQIYPPPTHFKLTDTSFKRLREISRHFKLLMTISRNEIIFSQRNIYQIEFALLLLLFKKIFKKKLIFDIDDAVYTHTPKLTNLLIRNADVVLGGGKHVKQYCRGLNQRTFLLRTSIPLSQYVYKTNYRIKQKAIIGWIGDVRAHGENLKILAKVFKKLVNEKIKFKFRLIGTLGNRKIHNLFQNIKGLNLEIIETLNWENTKAVSKEIAKFDIGLMPLTNTAFNRAKYFKLFEYMACGVPVIVSNLGEAKEIIKPGINGLLSKNTEDWIRNIISLYNNRVMREKLGMKGRKTIRDNYAMKKTAQQLIKIIKSEIYEEK